MSPDCLTGGDGASADARLPEKTTVRSLICRCHTSPNRCFMAPSTGGGASPPGPRRPSSAGLRAWACGLARKSSNAVNRATSTACSIASRRSSSSRSSPASSKASPTGSGLRRTASASKRGFSRPRRWRWWAVWQGPTMGRRSVRRGVPEVAVLGPHARGAVNVSALEDEVLVQCGREGGPRRPVLDRRSAIAREGAPRPAHEIGERCRAARRTGGAASCRACGCRSIATVGVRPRGSPRPRRHR